MLKKRIFTAIFLFAVLFSVFNFASGQVWTAFSNAVSLLILYEYSLLCGLNKKELIVYLLSTILFMQIGIYYQTILNYIPHSFNIIETSLHIGIVIFSLLIVLFWFVVVPLFLQKKYSLKNKFFIYLVGWIVVLPFNQTIVLAFNNKEWLLFAIIGVCVADTMAFFIGKLLGKHKLAKTISPGKSWEGALGGFVSVCIFAAICFYYFIYSASNEFRLEKFSIIYVILFLMVGGYISFFSVLGDLFESLLKRSAGVKDSGALLPGHGGIFDRLDGMIPVISLMLPITIVLNVITYLMNNI